LLDGAARRTGHRPHVESLNPDHLKPPCKVGGGLFDKVLTPIFLTGFQPGDRVFRFFAAMGTSLSAREPLLQHV
jgi:hypothetical protein